MSKKAIPSNQLSWLGGICPYCKRDTALPTLCSHCHRSHCARCRLTVGSTVLCPHCVLLIVAKRTEPKPVNEWSIYGGHSIHCDNCSEDLRTGDGAQYDKIRIREDMSIWCDDCCAGDPMPAEKLLADECRQPVRQLNEQSSQESTL